MLKPALHKPGSAGEDNCAQRWHSLRNRKQQRPGENSEIPPTEVGGWFRSNLHARTSGFTYEFSPGRSQFDAPISSRISGTIVFRRKSATRLRRLDNSRGPLR